TLCCSASPERKLTQPEGDQREAGGLTCAHRAIRSSSARPAMTFNHRRLSANPSRRDRVRVYITRSNSQLRPHCRQQNRAHQHTHAPGIVECPNGDLLVSWYRGSGERQADDVAVYGARRRRGQEQWSEPFVLADTPGFPDCNTAMFIDGRDRLWLFWPIILANTWESCVTSYRVASQYDAEGPPKWEWQG